jgi:RecA-family ATPase
MSTLLPVTRACEIEDRPQNKRWLVENLWADQAVGIIGGEPKCCKSFLALDMAVAVASGTPCLRHFPVNNQGSVLLYAAEDALPVVRQRLEGICACANIDLAKLDLHVITSPVLRLDRPEDLTKLKSTIEVMRPRLLILDPFVRLYRIDENNSGEVAPILASLREFQRTFTTSIIVVHHAKKGGSSERAGQALRGSSEFHAWGDSNLYLRRNKHEQLSLTVEQRAGASRAGIHLELHPEGKALGLRIVPDQVSTPTVSSSAVLLPDKILGILKDSATPMTLRLIRERCHTRTASISAALDALVQANQVTKAPSGYSLS